MNTEPRKRHPSGLFDAHAKRAFVSAQQEAEERGGKFLVSGLVLHMAAKAEDDFAARLLDAMGCDLSRLDQAVDAEWSARSPYMQDRPATLVNKAFNAVASEAQPDTELQLEALLVRMLSYPDSMASRVAARLGVEPHVLAQRLTEL